MDDRIIADLKSNYGLTCNQMIPVTGGLLNRKWRVSTNKGDLLVKQYSAERFRREQLEKIEAALQRQVMLGEDGVACPYLWQTGGNIIRWLDSKTAYMVMDFCPGKMEDYNTITVTQMCDLGSACAVMHESFSWLPAVSFGELPSFGGYSMESLWENFNSRKEKCVPDTNAEYQKALFSMEPILNRLDTEFFNRFPKGFAHEDFHSGNILFGSEKVTAIVDFDRNCYSYIWHDIGRAILSFALEGDKMNLEKVHAFLDGYSRHLMLTNLDIADALRLSWCIETPWWIQPVFFGECDKTPKRFRDEMLWLTEHWNEINSILLA